MNALLQFLSLFSLLAAVSSLISGKSPNFLSGPEGLSSDWKPQYHSPLLTRRRS